MQYLGYNVSDKELDSARSRLLSAYSHGVREWGGLVSRFDDLSDHPDHNHVCYAGHWNGLSRTSNDGPPACTEIHRCSWCYMPSAALKRCKKCAKTMCIVVSITQLPSLMLMYSDDRYCDTDCQRSHWSVHKSACLQ